MCMMPSERQTRETGYKPVHRRRRMRRHSARTRAESERHISLDDGGDQDSDRHVSTSRNKSRWLSRKRMPKVVEENDTRRTKPEDGTESGNIAPSKVKEKRLSKDLAKLVNDYYKLEKQYEGVQEECLKLNGLLDRRETEYQFMCSRYEAMVGTFQEIEDARIAVTARNQALKIENARSSEDIMLLKNVVYQLNRELERYQDRIGKQSRVDAKASANNLGSISVNRGNKNEEKDTNMFESWGTVSFHALGPLLNAYEESLFEKRDLVAIYEERLADFGNRCKEIVAENGRMHKEVEDLRSKCDRYAEEIGALVENSRSLKKRQDLLVTETASRKRYTDEAQSLYQRKIESILERNETLRKAYEYSMSELSNIRGKYEILSREFEQAKVKEKDSVPVVVHTAAIEECTRLLEELKFRYETEKKNLCNQIRQIEETRPENEKQLAMVTAERNHLKVLSKLLERKFKHAQRKTEHVQNVACSTRSARDIFKERLQKAIACCQQLFFEYEKIAAEKEKLLTLLHEREKENVTVDRIGKNVTDRMNDLRSQLEIVRRGAKQEVATVEKRMKLQQFRIRRMKRGYRRKMRHLRTVVKQKDDIIGKLRNERHIEQHNLSQTDKNCTEFCTAQRIFSNREI